MAISKDWLARLQRLQKMIACLEARIIFLQDVSRRFSWIRFFVFIFGVAVTWAANELFGSLAAWSAFLAALGVFLLVAFYHQRVETWINKFKIWRELYQQQAARLQLDWDALPFHALPEARWRNSLEIDLDLTGRRSLHHLIDQAISEGGSQLLATWLSNPTPDLEMITTRQAIVRELTAQPRFGMRLQLAFRLASREALKGSKLLNWFALNFNAQRFKWTLPLATILAFLNLSLFVWSMISGAPAYWIVSALLYLLFYNYTGRENAAILDEVAPMDAELGKLRPVLRYLEQASYRHMPALAECCDIFHRAGDLPSADLRKVKLVTAAVGLRMNPVFGLLLNIFLPWDYFWAFLAERYRRQLAQKLPIWLDTLYRLEALLSLAGFGQVQPESCFPEISCNQSALFQVEKLGHPLLPALTRVGNDFSIHNLGEIAIITGSNMAGKSTFIKAVGINLCLAYAGGQVNAVVWRSQPLRLHSCIRISDSLSDGFSYFYAEVKCLSSLLEKLTGKGDGRSAQLPVLYLIDEIFRGTNNRERLIGSQAYIRAALDGRGVGLVATHDLELATLAEQHAKVKNYHFRDRVEAGRLVFDYKIQSGPSPTTNALRIMAMEGLPVDAPTDE